MLSAFEYTVRTQKIHQGKLPLSPGFLTFPLELCYTGENEVRRGLCDKAGVSSGCPLLGGKGRGQRQAGTGQAACHGGGIYPVQQHLCLATGTGDYVRCTPIEYSWHDGCFWMFSEGGKKFIGLEKNPNVCLAIYNKYEGFGKLHGMQVMGTAELVEPFSRAITPMRHIKRFYWTFCANCLLPCISFVSGYPHRLPVL